MWLGGDGLVCCWGLSGEGSVVGLGLMLDSLVGFPVFLLSGVVMGLVVGIVVGVCASMLVCVQTRMSVHECLSMVAGVVFGVVYIYTCGVMLLALV